MNDEQRARDLIEQSKREEWLTVKEFANRVGMQEHSVREAIRKRRLNKKYRIERVTDGPKGTIRIVIPSPAA